MGRYTQVQRMIVAHGMYSINARVVTYRSVLIVLLVVFALVFDYLFYIILFTIKLYFYQVH